MCIDLKLLSKRRCLWAYQLQRCIFSTCIIANIFAYRSDETQLGDVTLYTERPRSRIAQMVHQRA